MLTTPIVKDDDIVFPGEGWFLYWKTSASLWRSKIEELTTTQKIFIPINWSFHSDTGERFDFASEKPETDLKKLTDICHEFQKEVIFLLPVTPAPYLPNGGVPYLLARVNSQDEYGSNRVFVDADGNVNQIYSFYDPRIFTAFTRFCFELSKYFTTAGINAGVWAIECGHFENNRFETYIKDHSTVFEKGFSKFLKAKIESKEIEDAALTPEREVILKNDYQQMISNLYYEAAQNELSTYWQGSKKFGFLLGETKDLFERSLDSISEVDLIDNAINFLSHGVCPSTMLIPPLRKKGILKSFRNKVLTREFIEMFFSDRSVTTTYDFCFKPSFKLKIFFNQNLEKSFSNIEESGFISYCNDKITNSVLYENVNTFNWEDEIDNGHKAYFFTGVDLTIKTLSSALKMFMNGMNVFLDKRDLSDTLARRLESFYIENDLQVEKIRYLTQIETISIGQGRLFIFDSSELTELEGREAKIMQFWERVFNTLEIESVVVDSEKGIRYFWLERNVGHNELKFEKVRRINIFNPSSYKKKMKIKLPSNLVFQKIIDEENVQLSNSTHEIEVNFMPKGSVSLDFGVISK